MNFYQTQGLVHGRLSIRAEDPDRTDMLDTHMWCENRRISCRNYGDHRITEACESLPASPAMSLRLDMPADGPTQTMARRAPRPID